jgi:quercetin dioxygenase-like cupin family protein
MNSDRITRRDWTFLLPAMLATAAEAAPAKQRKLLPAMTYKFEDLHAKASPQNTLRDVFDGVTHTGLQIDIHETELPPGGAPHPPHRHTHEEIILIREGKLEVMIEGKVTIVDPGSVVYVASNDFHGWKNAGPTHAHYFVFAIGRVD